MKIIILTLFKDYFASPFSTSIIKRAVESGAVEFEIVDIRDFARNKHQTTDDRPFGGGSGMVMMIEPIDLALSEIKSKLSGKSLVILTSAKGKRYNQQKAVEYSHYDNIIIICGHYEGVDERVVESLVDEEVRIGDYVLTGGEPAAVVIADSVARLLPGVLGNEESIRGESHEEPGRLGYPQYTRPAEYKGMKVPDVLLGGNHQEISAWREKMRAKDDN